MKGSNKQDLFQKRALAALTDDFEGKKSKFEDFSDYDGNFEDFSARTKAEVAAKSKVYQFKFTITNLTGEQKSIALLPGLIRTERPCVPDTSAWTIPAIGGGTIDVAENTIPYMRYDEVSGFASVKSVDAMLYDGTIYVDADDDTKTIAVTSPTGREVVQFLEFVKRNFCRIKSIDMNANDQGVWDGELVVKDISPFRATGEDVIALTDYLKQDSLITNKIVVDPSAKGMEIQLDDQTMVVLTLPGTVNGEANVVITLQFNLEVMNPAAASFERILAGNSAIR